MTALLPLLAALATALGLGALASASTGADGAVSAQLAAQGAHAALGLVAGGLVGTARPGRVREWAWALWLGGVALLVLVWAHGYVAGGARSWLVVGGLRFQPTELWKLILPVALAAETCRPAPLRRLADWARVACLVGVPLALLALQPDLGAVVLLGVAAVGLVWTAGVPRIALLGASVAALLGAPLVWGLLAPYQRDRVLVFLDPARDPDGAGYQTLQSLIAVGAGGWTGAGFGAGTQGRLGFLPEHETDFALAVLAEEWGALGAIAALAVLLGLVAAGLSVAERCRDRFSALVATGLSLQLLVQIAVNAGGVLGLLPLTGVTLPFFSYGGSSMVVGWMTVGLLVSLSRRPARGLAAGQVRFGPNEAVPDLETLLAR